MSIYFQMGLRMFMFHAWISSLVLSYLQRLSSPLILVLNSLSAMRYAAVYIGP